MKLIIAGTRTLQITPTMIDHEIGVTGWTVTEVVCGMCQGPDLDGKTWAELRGIPVKRMPADWQTFGSGAGPIRNSAMARYADGGLVFWNGLSRGSEDMITKLRKRKKPHRVVVL